MPLLTKSRYMLGLQCPLILWMDSNKRSELPKPDEALQHRFDQGTKVGEFATSVFTGGISIPHDSFMGNIRKTQLALKLDKPLFEAGFMVDNMFARADVLRPVGSGYDIIEVKSSTRVKDEHIQDMAFQKHVYEKSGLVINKCYLMHINNQYVKDGEIEPDKLFNMADITEDVIVAQKGIQDRIENMQAIIKGPKPDMQIGKYCLSPYQCALTDSCWAFIPDDNIFDLYRGGIKSWELFESDIVSIKDIPDDYKLTDKQDIQKKCAQENEVYIDNNKIADFLSKLEYPLHFLDFESFQTAIPFYDGTRPYEQIPFQFSLHIIEKEGDEPKHISFIADGTNDPRLTFLVSLNNVIKDKGTIIAYNDQFEKSVIANLVKHYPSYSEWANNLMPRFLDLLTPFRNFWYYDPKQAGSASIKKVLPVMSDMSYSGMNIAHGEAASLAFLRIIQGAKDVEQIRSDLEKYCALDTLALVEILDKLRNI